MSLLVRGYQPSHASSTQRLDRGRSSSALSIGLEPLISQGRLGRGSVGTYNCAFGPEVCHGGRVSPGSHRPGQTSAVPVHPPGTAWPAPPSSLAPAQVGYRLAGRPAIHKTIPSACAPRTLYLRQVCQSPTCIIRLHMRLHASSVSAMTCY